MIDRTIVALDAMGGDNAPKEMIKGAVQALEKTDAVQVLLVGKEDVIRAELAQYTYDKTRIEIVNATEVIETAEPPVNAIRRKKDSSIVVGMNLVKGGQADAIYICRKYWGCSGWRTGNRRTESKEWKDLLLHH